MENRAFIVFLFAVTILFVGMLSPFFAPIFWACAIAIIFYPLKHWLGEKWGDEKSNRIALATLGAALFIVILPFIFLLTIAIQEVQDVYASFKSGDIDITEYFDNLKNASPMAADQFERFGITVADLKQRITAGVNQNGKQIAEQTLNLGQIATSFLVSFGIMLYIAFFMIRDGEKIKELLVEALPLGDERERLLFKKFSEVTRAAIKGNLVVAIVQGSIGGIAFWALGIPSAILWAFAMAFASLIPAVGAALIWAPVAAYFLLVGEYVSGIVLIAVGAGVIGMVDNFLRPILVGRDVKLPDYIILTSTLGGLAMFGLNGFIVGPLIAALFVASWGIFMREFSEDYDENRVHGKTDENKENTNA